MRPLMDLRRTTERCSHAMGTARTNLDQPTSVIIADDPEFSHALAARWQTERNLPAFTLMSGDLCQALDPDTFVLAVVGTLEPPLLASALKALEPAGKPVLVVCDANATAQAIREKHATAMVLRQDEGWLDSLMLVAAEALRRCQPIPHAPPLPP